MTSDEFFNEERNGFSVDTCRLLISCQRLWIVCQLVESETGTGMSERTLGIKLSGLPIPGGLSV